MKDELTTTASFVNITNEAERVEDRSIVVDILHIDAYNSEAALFQVLCDDVELQHPTLMVGCLTIHLFDQVNIACFWVDVEVTACHVT